MKFSLFIDTELDLDAVDVSKILKSVSTILNKKNYNCSGQLKDINNNLIGNWIYTQEMSSEEEDC